MRDEFLRDNFEGVIVCANRHGGFEELDDDVLLSLGDHAGAVLENHRLHGEVRSSYLAVVRMLADAIEAKDPFVRASSDEVSACVEVVARRLELDDRASEKLVFAGILRDVGKLGISEKVLLKPAPLNADERAIVELHPLIGARIVERVPGLADIAPAIRHHHERWDGNGYPDRLGGEAIPLEARVIAVADTYSALTSTRPYRRPVSPELACEEIERCAGHAVRSGDRRPVCRRDAQPASGGSRPGDVGRVSRRPRRPDSAQARGAAPRSRPRLLDRSRHPAVLPPLSAGGGGLRGAARPAPAASVRGGHGRADLALAHQPQRGLRRRRPCAEGARQGGRAGGRRNERHRRPLQRTPAGRSCCRAPATRPPRRWRRGWRRASTARVPKSARPSRFGETGTTARTCWPGRVSG